MAEALTIDPKIDMRALLLAAGVGSRLRPITENVPKCLVPIHGRPLLDYWLETLFAENAVDRALINIHHLAAQVDAYLSHSRWRDRIDVVYEPKLLGTGGTLKANRAYFGNDSFLVAHADNLTDFDPAAFQAAHAIRPKQCAITMLTYWTDDPSSCGIVEIDGDNIVQQFHEKVAQPPGNLANAAVYLFTPEAADFTANLPVDFADLSIQVIPEFVGRIFVLTHIGFHRDIGNPTSLAKAHAEFPLPDAASHSR